MSPVPNPTIADKNLNKDAVEQQVNEPEEGNNLQEVDFYNPFDGTKGRPGGVYLDVKERVDAEELRAQSEKRKPDYNNAPAVAGTPLVTDAFRVNNDFANPASMAVAPVKEVDPVSTLEVDFGSGEQEIDRSAEDQAAKEEEARNSGTNDGNDGGGTTPASTTTTVTV